MMNREVVAVSEVMLSVTDAGGFNKWKIESEKWRIIFYIKEILLR